MPSSKMKAFLLFLSIVALSGLVLAKPIGNRSENLLNALLAFQQEEDDNGKQLQRKFVEQQEDGGKSDNDGVVIAQDEGGDRQQRARLEDENVIMGQLLF